MRAASALLAIALGAAACAPVNPSVATTPTPTREPGGLNVTALLDLSGPRASSGVMQRDALQLWLDQHGAGSPRVRLKVVDVAGSTARLIVELRRAAVEDRADAVVIGVPVEYDDPFANAVQLARIPVLFTFPLPDPATTGGGWGFALAPTPQQLARQTLDHAARQTVLAGAIVVSDESPTAVVERAALVADLVRRGVAPTVLKTGSADSARVRSSLAGSAIILFAGTPKSYLEIARGAPSAALLYFSYQSELSDIGDLRDATPRAIWPGSRWIATGASVSTSARATFIQSYADRWGPPPTPAASAFDALALLARAATGGTDAPRLRDRLQADTFEGIATIYTFSTTRRAGFAVDDLALLRYVSGRSAPIVR